MNYCPMFISGLANSGSFSLLNCAWLSIVLVLGLKFSGDC